MIEKEKSKLWLLLKHSDIFDYLKKLNRGEVNLFEDDKEIEATKKEEQDSWKRRGLANEELEIQEVENVDQNFTRIDK